MGNSVNKFLFIFVRKMHNCIRVSFVPKSEILLDNLLQDLGQLREVGCQYRIKCQPDRLASVLAVLVL